ncbi:MULTISPECIES: acetolactate synthase 2 small subunit [Pseudoalteromonas]|uniref:Acetolactate synthase 2 small subunit n=1 Tax=Pseudoalteromonas haloplanktis TaxID=228 RepID=A0ABU1BEG3_PSEHA|nr:MULTISPECIES: acetolactate synthase 2 small subunit [Pseudoalteromonas]MCF6144339.1 acetolactate synthase II small subunit [Pseudoalteromonas mariniglutinosa NCIMB 1770]MDQ9092786.1 acetolactate synthase 2 small subunit [Pseudoalteromonas haloplanktis]BDF96339.1 acetolactate synthase [Pseudoalteromonas sp. KAN5]
MKHSLTVALKNQSVAVERFLRVVRHRGFDLTHFQLNMDDGHYHVAMTVDSDKPIYLLTTQLNKLVDVKHVTLQNNLQQQAV